MRLSPLFYVTAQATEEGIVNATVAAEIIPGAEDVRVRRLFQVAVRRILDANGRGGG